MTLMLLALPFPVQYPAALPQLSQVRISARLGQRQLTLGIRAAVADVVAAAVEGEATKVEAENA